MLLNEDQPLRARSDRRRRVLSAAQNLFLANGFSRTTIDAIVKMAGISKTDFYAFFDDREAVFLEVAKGLTGSAGRQFNLMEGAPVERLADAAFRMVGSQLAAEPIGIFRAAIVATRLAPALASEVYQSRVGMVKSIGRYFDELAAQGVASFDDGHLTAIRFGALATDGVRYLAGRPLPDPAILQRTARKIAEVFVSGYATRSLRENPHQRCPAAGDALLNWTPPLRAPPIGAATRLSEERWEAVLDSAWIAFRDLGFEQVSMEAVGKAVGLPKNTIYRRYKSKAGLFAAACKKVIEEAFPEPAKPEWANLSVRASLIGVAQELQHLFCTPDMLELNRLVIVHAAGDPATASNIYEHLVQRIDAQLGPMIESLVAAGLLCASTAGVAAWQFFVLATFNTRFLFISPKSDGERLCLSSEAVDVFLFGLTRPVMRPAAR